ncbi:Aerobic cobaltochelatase subunit CobN [bacterium HR40]|nr:Aerobic cobaltochelatase subunit CobN [bacterium HR40]
MHLLSAARATTAECEEAVDLGQSPAEVVILSTADSELALLAEARARAEVPLPSLRLANLARLAHPLSVDLYVEKVVAQARFVLVRLLGGRSYWSYGLEQVEAVCRTRQIALAVLPGDDRPDPELDALSTVEPSLARALWQYLVQGGLGNAEQCLRRIAAALGSPVDWLPPAPLPRAVLWRPGRDAPMAEEILSSLAPADARALLLFYRAHFQAGDIEPIEALAQALEERGLRTLPLAVASQRDPESAAAIEAIATRLRPDVILDATAFSVAAPGGPREGPLAACDAPVLQLLLAGRPRELWRADPRGLGPRDLAMQVVLPEVDGRITTRTIGFKESARFDEATQCHLQRFIADRERIAFVAELAARWVRLRRTPRGERRIAIVLANYPNRDGRLANGVGLDTPESVAVALSALAEAGYRVDPLPRDGNELIAWLRSGPTNELDSSRRRIVRVRFPLADYERAWADLPAPVREAVYRRWGEPTSDPHFRDGGFALPIVPLGNLLVAIQPGRGYHLDPKATYHDPALVPPHAYFAFYLWLRRVFDAHAIVHFGKHGNLEWLPGKAVALAADCFPDAVLGPLPHLYPFIVNDPGEGSQAKRRAQAVIVDHLTPPLTRAGLEGGLRELERLVDEYAEAVQLDRRRCEPLAHDILAWVTRLGLDRDLEIDTAAPPETWLSRIDAHLCDLKELQIRDGLHVFGKSPEGERRIDTLLALARLPRGRGHEGDLSLLRALAADLGLEEGFDPLDCDFSRPWTGARPEILQAMSGDPWRTAGDTVERLERLAREVIAERRDPPASWVYTRKVLSRIREDLGPRLDACGKAEIEGLLAGLDGRFVLPGPSGAPTRGRPEVLPTGRNFYSVDTRGVPTPAAFTLGWKAAERVIAAYAQTHGDWPRHLALSAWGTANMRTGGEDIAQALAFLGCRPVWEGRSHRVSGVEVIPCSLLGRPRVDVTLRVSGFFRDAFFAQIELFDDAVRAVAALDEPADVNPLAAAARGEAARLQAEGVPAEEAWRQATLRIFGSPPGAYGCGLQVLIDEGIWRDDGDLAEVYVGWSGYAYGRAVVGAAARGLFERRLAATQLVLHNQDNREHDLLDSDDYYQFLGGLVAAVRRHAHRQPEVLFGDHSRPESPRVRRLAEEIGRVVRGRAANPKWIRGVMRHGYKGAFEMAATVDYLFAFAATTRLVGDHHFDCLFAAYLEDEEVRAFIARANPDALREMAQRFREALDRGLWRPRSNHAALLLDRLCRQPAGGGQ